MESVQATICVTLWHEIEVRGGQASSEASPCYERCLAQRSLKDRIRVATRGQEHRGRAIAKALPHSLATSLHAILEGMRDLHQRHVDRWKILVG